MSDQPNDGGAVFPLPLGMDQHGNLFQRVNGGISLRDYFAAKAMNGLMLGMHDFFRSDWQSLAINAYNIADAMLAERLK